MRRISSIGLFVWRQQINQIRRFFSNPQTPDSVIPRVIAEYVFASQTLEAYTVIDLLRSGKANPLWFLGAKSAYIYAPGYDRLMDGSLSFFCSVELGTRTGATVGVISGFVYSTASGGCGLFEAPFLYVFLAGFAVTFLSVLCSVEEEKPGALLLCFLTSLPLMALLAVFTLYSAFRML